MSRHIPKYRLHKATGQAVVTLDGRDNYLGKHGTAVSRAEYERLIAEWLLRRGTSPAQRSAADLTVDEVLLRYWTFA